MLGGDWRFPDEESMANGGGKKKAKGKGKGRNGQGGEEAEDGGISEGVKEVVRRCLRVESLERPDVDELIEMIERAVEGLPAEEGEDDGDT